MKGFTSKDTKGTEGKTKIKTVFIKARRGSTQRQAKDMEIIMQQARGILLADEHDEVLVETAIAVGYANAMFMHDLIDARELQNLVDMLGTMGEDTIKKVDKINLQTIMRHFRRAVAQ